MTKRGHHDRHHCKGQQRKPASRRRFRNAHQGPQGQGIRLTDNPGEIECSTKQVKGLVLKTEFLKKA
ncbi:PhnA domain-containing protein [Rhizobium leguminosarum]|uniref:PhnA domain-containing protein n=1 Tax=Rhizobium leguminosarum TaxID=384 RepID=UPI0039658098